MGNSSPRPWRILVVEDSDLARSGLVEVLERAGYHVLAAATFEQGRQLLATEDPDLLITDLRLGDFNGLQLLICEPKPIPAVVITGFADRVLEAEAKRLGAAYFVKPISPTVLLRVIEEKLSHEPVTTLEPKRRWVRKPVHDRLPAQIDSRSAQIHDVSYGGLCLEVLDTPLPMPGRSFEVTLPTKDVVVRVNLIWQDRTRDGSWLCGAALSRTDPGVASAWHTVVDTIS